MSEEQNEKRKPGRPKADKLDIQEPREITTEDIAAVIHALGAVPSFWGSIDPKRVIAVILETVGRR